MSFRGWGVASSWKDHAHVRVAHVIILRFAASIEDLHMQEVLAADALQYSKRHVHEFMPCM